MYIIVAGAGDMNMSTCVRVAVNINNVRSAWAPRNGAKEHLTSLDMCFWYNRITIFGRLCGQLPDTAKWLPFWQATAKSLQMHYVSGWSPFMVMVLDVLGYYTCPRTIQIDAPSQSLAVLMRSWQCTCTYSLLWTSTYSLLWTSTVPILIVVNKHLPADLIVVNKHSASNCCEQAPAGWSSSDWPWIGTCTCTCTMQCKQTMTTHSDQTSDSCHGL